MSWLVLLAVFALVAAACSSSGGGTTTTAAPATTTTKATTTTSGGGGGTTSTSEAAMEVKTDIGVDAASKTINIGLLADLTGIFSGLTTDIVDAQLTYWKKLNAAGGIDGWTVNPIVEDTNYNVDQHMEKYAKIRDQIVAISNSTGSPTSVKMLGKILADNDPILFIPLSWYSGWAIPDFDHKLALEQNTNYCIEAMNILGFIKDQGGKKIALATFPGDYGGDAAAGVKKAIEYYKNDGMELVYDGEGQVIPGQDQAPVVQGIVNSGADWVFLTTNPSIGAEILGGAAAQGFTGNWTGSVPTYDFRLLDSPAAELYDKYFYQSAYNVPWGSDVPGMAEIAAAMKDAFPDRRPSDAFVIGWDEALTMHKVLEQAIKNGDLTRQGVIDAGNSLTGIDFQGVQPDQSYSGTPNDYVQRKLAMFKPNLKKYQDAGGKDQTLSQEGGTTGSELIQDFFTSDAAKDFDFTEPCYHL